MSYVLSQGTADKLKALLNTSGGSGAGASGGSNRQEGWITVTLAEDGEYEGTVNYYDAVNEVWETFASVVVLPCNEDDTLVEGRRYIGQRSGDTLEGDSIWIVSAASEVEVCCGLRIVEAEDDPTGCDPGTIVVDGGPLFGAGIAWNESECQAYLDTGCGITLEGGEKIGVHAGDLAGPGLIATTGCKLEVNAGQCLTVDDDGKLNVQLQGVFSAVTAISKYGKQLRVTTTAFSFDGCTLGSDSSSDSYLDVCDCEDEPPQEYYWCYAGSCTLSATQPEGSVGPFATQLDCTDQCYLTPPDCHECEFSVNINGTSYPLESFGGTGYIGAFEDGWNLYMTPPVECEAFWQVSLYDGAYEKCRWEIYWNGSGCATLEQITNNGIPFTECPASEVELCCNGGDTDPPDPPDECDPSVCGQQGWIMTSGTWVWDGSISCDCGTPTYPPFDSPEGIHTTTCCEPDGGDNPCLGGTCDFYWSPSDPNAVNGWVATNGQCMTNCTCDYPTASGSPGQTITGRTCVPVTS